MKSIRQLFLFGMALAASVYFANAQTDSSTDFSAEDVATMLQALEQGTPTSAAFLPEFGTFWSAQHAPGTPSAWPPLPGNTLGLNAWPIGDSNYVLNDTNVNYDAIAAAAAEAASMSRSGFHADDSGPGFPGAGSGDGTNTYSYDGSGYVLPDYGTNLWIAQPAVADGWLTGIGSNTIADVLYEIQSRTNLLQTDWQSEGFLTGSETTNWTQLGMPQNSRTNLFIRLRSWIDSDNVGIPDWWQLEYFGYVGINPNAPDPAGDGYTNLQKYQMGLDPNIFTPPAVNNFIAVLSTDGTNVILSWTPSTGAVQQYALGRYDFDYDTYNYDFTSLGQVGSNTVSFVDSTDTNVISGDYSDTYYQIQAVYTNGTTPAITAPIQFSPPPPQGMTVTYNNSTGTATVNWQTSPGSVTGYTILRQNNATSGFSTIATVSAGQTSYTDSSYPGGYAVEYEVEAIYAEGVTSPGNEENPRTAQELTVPAFIVRGTNGSLFLAVASVPKEVTAFRVYRTDSQAASYPISSYIYSELFSNYTNSIYTLEPTELFSSGIGNGYFDVPVTNFVNGVCELTINQVPSYGTFAFQIQALSSDGMSGEMVTNGYATGDAGRADYNIPFYDGRTQIAQNITFLLRATQFNVPFALTMYVDGEGYNYSGNADYVFAGFHFCNNNNGSPLVMNEFQPFEENNYYKNFCYSSTNVDTNGNLDTGIEDNRVSGDPSFGEPYFIPYSTYSPTIDYFDTLGYVSGASSPSFSAVLNGTTPQWQIFGDEYFVSDIFGTNCYIPNTQNIYGLSLISVKWPGVNTPPTFSTLSPGNAGTDAPGDWFFQYAQPTLSSNGYYFARHHIDPLPGESNFSVTNTTPPIIFASLGQPFAITAWAKQSLQNGYSGKFAYAEQYFDAAYLADTNGNTTTNQSGILSEYGEYFPTQPGTVILTTKADGALGTVGKCAVNVISLNVDANHDGSMDLNFNGADVTSANSPYVFWCNNNFDRWDKDYPFDTPEQDDQQVAFCPATPSTPTPDCNYYDFYGHRVIPDTRDLEDFSRLWICGFDTNILGALPIGSSVTLSWSDAGSPNSASPTIDLFAAADPDGGIGYLTNETVAVEQTNDAECPYIGRLGPGQSIQLNSILNQLSTTHFIWCGVSNGTGGLTLTVADPNGIILAQTTVYIKIVDIKQLYERWTVGDNPSVVPLTNAVLSTENLPVGTSAFQYPAPIGTNTPYILNVHGYNMAAWEKDRFAETEFKRLYWQGYQGRFGAFNWPTATRFFQFGQSESQSWLSARGLLNKLEDLNKKYPGQIYLTVHSLGNVAAGEALRLAGTNQVVNTYIAMQGAVSAHAYDPTTPEYTVPAIDDAGAPDCYAYYWTNGAPCYFNASAGAGAYVNFFNGGDFALSDAWLTFQDLKPSLNPSYSYVAPNLYYKNFRLTELYFPTNTYELFSDLVQSRSFAFGEEVNVAGPFKVGVVYKQVELDAAPYNFGTAHIYHSGEFRSDNEQLWQYWNQVLIQMKLK